MVLPAYAGMIPKYAYISEKKDSAPRVCGDDPFSNDGFISLDKCSPRMRG